MHARLVCNFNINNININNNIIIINIKIIRFHWIYLLEEFQFPRVPATYRYTLVCFLIYGVDQRGSIWQKFTKRGSIDENYETR